MTETVLATHGLTKNFGALKASDEVSIDLGPGEIHAVIGPNGAGKSALIAQICGTLEPSSGRVELLGKDVTRQSARQRSLSGLGRTFQISALAMEHTVLQNALLGALGSTGNPWQIFRPALTNTKLRQTAEIALERVGLQDVMRTRTAELSHGQRRQLEVAVALTLNPRAFIMDEPMAGLGAEGSKHLTELLSELRREVLGQVRDETKLKQDMTEMRKKIRNHLLPQKLENGQKPIFHLKHKSRNIINIKFTSKKILIFIFISRVLILIDINNEEISLGRVDEINIIKITKNW